MIGITTHVLDTSLGRPAAGVGVTLERLTGAAQWEAAGAGRTDDDGRLDRADAGPSRRMSIGSSSRPGRIFTRDGRRAFYPHVSIAFEVAAGETHTHVPLLLSPFGYTTYRGS